MGLYDKRNWKRWSVRQLLSLGCTLRERSEIEIEGLVTTTEFSSSSCGFISDLENSDISFEFEEVNTPRRPN